LQIDIAWFAGLAAAGSAVVMGLSRKLRASRQDAENYSRRLGRRRAAMELIQDGVVLVDARDQVVFANSAAASLMGVEEVTSVATLAVGYNSGETSRRIVRGAGTDSAPEGRSLELTVAPTPEGGRMFLLHDLSALAEVDERRRDFVSNASHEIQTPLAAIIGMLDLAVDSEDPEELKHLLERCQENALGLSAMTRDLLSLSRAEDPNWKPVPEEVNLQELCNRIASSLSDKANSKSLTLTASAGSHSIVVDRTSLETILSNLVDNAISYTNEGKVTLRAEIVDSKYAHFTVSDTGPGIPREIRPRIFERFFRGDPAHGRQSGGTGLGLAIVRNLVNRLGGKISLSTSKTTGTKFSVDLPLSPTQSL